ncbi:MAG: phosphorylase [Methylococcaceae bacterium]|nr:phosphorylase [Methylococcaceae bacterium]MDZ4155366.1 phosphorylase [Methylococcales bacterium]MDP2393978.1 phosphorylase [Methylococcaceae bacterium]MDP3018034.1 phosphorylase [Methylococcaceae bacterium]MDP3391855.1 phosphorylase [Methylococcaceae bacterium]
MITGFVVALPEELSTLTAKKIVKGCCLFIADDKVVAYSGTGPENARLAAELLVNQGAEKLISWGCAAALDTMLQPGNLVLATQLIDENQALLATDRQWLKSSQQTLQQHLTIQSGGLAESKTLVASGNEKSQLHKKTGAIAVDMESIAVAKVAMHYQIPFLAIRAIADPTSMDLPKAISAALNKQGDIDLSKLLLFILCHPNEIPGLIKLGLHFQAAKNTLKQVAKHLDKIVSYTQPSST